MDPLTFRHGFSIRSSDGSPLAGDLVATTVAGGALHAIVADVAGSGWGAGRDALRARSLLAEAVVLEPVAALEFVHAGLEGTRGAVAVAAVFEPAGSVRFAGVGDVLLRRWRAGGFDRYVMQHGQLGGRGPHITERSVDVEPGDVFFATTDGIRTQADLGSLRILRGCEPAALAERVVDRWRRDYDDGTCLVVSADVG